jgi:hypothetical protein
MVGCGKGLTGDNDGRNSLHDGTRTMVGVQEGDGHTPLRREFVRERLVDVVRSLYSASK